MSELWVDSGRHSWTKMIMVAVPKMICFPRVFPKMIMVGVVGVRENASWPRILLGLPQDDHGV